ALRGGHGDRSDPTLERARKDAKRLRREHEAGDPAALARADAALQQRRPGPLKLADAQHVVAVERGARSWPDLVERSSEPDAARRAARRAWDAKAAEATELGAAGLLPPLRAAYRYASAG